MARSAIPTYTTGDLITAAHANAYWRDNEAYYYSIVGGGITPANTTFLDAVFSDAEVYFGKVAANGSTLKLPSGWSASRTALGKYTVTHNLASTDYIVVALAITRGVYLNSQTSNNFTLWCVNNADVYADEIFNFILIEY